MQSLAHHRHHKWQSRAIALILLMLLPALAFSKTAPNLEITGNASEAVTHNIQALIDLSRYPCHPPQAQYGLIRRQINC